MMYASFNDLKSKIDTMQPLMGIILQQDNDVNRTDTFMFVIKKETKYNLCSVRFDDDNGAHFLGM